MQLTKNGITINVPDAQVVDLVLQKLNSHTTQPGINTTSLPTIGDYWPGQGGIFAGLMRGRDGGKDYALILGPAFEEGTFKELNQKAAEATQEGHSDYRLPYRNEQSLLYANLKDQFKPTWYWSCERRPGGEDFAYAQDFFDGDQSYWDVDYNYLGVAVRVVHIQ